MENFVTEEELIAYVKPYLKSKGFKKKNKRWTKEIDGLTISFLIHGSRFSREAYYIRPGIFINALLPTDSYCGHWMGDIKNDTPEKVMSEFEKWCEEWTNKPLIKERLLAFLEWEKRNPLEKRRAGLVDYENDPVPFQEFFHANLKTRQFILDHF